MIFLPPKVSLFTTISFHSNKFVERVFIVISFHFIVRDSNEKEMY